MKWIVLIILIIFLGLQSCAEFSKSWAYAFQGVFTITENDSTETLTPLTFLVTFFECPGKGGCIYSISEDSAFVYATFSARYYKSDSIFQFKKYRVSRELITSVLPSYHLLPTDSLEGVISNVILNEKGFSQIWNDPDLSEMDCTKNKFTFTLNHETFSCIVTINCKYDFRKKQKFFGSYKYSTKLFVELDRKTFEPKLVDYVK